MADVWAACQETAPDLILYHMKASGAPEFAEQLRVPCMLAFWGRHLERLGVGPTPIPQKKLTVEHLCNAIEVVPNDSTMRQNAAALGNRLRKDNGTSNAVAFITQWMISQ